MKVYVLTGRFCYGEIRRVLAVASTQERIVDDYHFYEEQDYDELDWDAFEVDSGR